MDESNKQQDEDSIKAAVREATKKTQDRLAAYQKKQEAAKAALAFEEKNKTPSKDAQEAESTVAKLQALVGESRRLTAKSREINEKTTTSKTTNDVPATPATPLKMPAFARSQTDSNIAARLSQSTTATPKASLNHTSTATTPKARKLSELFQGLNSSASGGLSHPTPKTPKTPGFQRSATVGAASSSQTPTHTPGGSLAKGKKLGVTPATPKTPGFQRSATVGAASSSQTPTHTPGGSLAKGKKLGAIFKSLNGSGTKNELSDGITKLAHMTPGDVLDEKSSLSHHANLKKSNHAASTIPTPPKRRSSKPEVQAEDDEKNIYSDDEIDEEEEEGDDDYSIFKMVDSSKKEQAVAASAGGVSDLRPDEIEDLMEDYYNDPPPDGAAGEPLDTSLPLLEAILETPKPEKPKGKIVSAKKKKKQKDDNDSERSLPLLEAVADQVNARRESMKTMSAIKEIAEKEKLDDMPTLAPFNTPKVEKPKLAQATAGALGKGTSPPPPPSVMAMQEESLNLSQIMRQPDMVMVPDHANSRANNNHEDSEGSGTSHKSGLRRPSMEHTPKEDVGGSISPHRAKAPRRKSAKGKSIDDDAASTKTGRSKGSTHSRKSRKSSMNKGSGHKKNEEIASRAINKYHRTGGQGSSTMDVCEMTGEPKAEMDISAISDNSSENDKSLKDGSDSMGGSSHHSSRSTRSMSRSARRGRTSGGDSGSRRGVSRSRSRRQPTRSVSRSASVRRNRRRNQGTDEENNASMRSKSMRDTSSRRSRAQSLARDSSLRDSSARDGRRRRSISTRRPARRNQKALDGSESESHQSTADDILGSLDVSDIKIVGEEEDKKSKMDESGRTSIYDKTKPKPTGSLAGLSRLESTETAQPDDDDNHSVADSVHSATTKKSVMGKFARKVGRTLVMKKKKKKKGAEGDESDEEEEAEEEEEEVDLEQLAADFDEEEKEISGSMQGSFAKGDFSQVAALGADEVEDPKSDKKPRKSVFGKIKNIGKIGKKKKKKDKKGKGSEMLDSDSESDEDELLGSEYSAGTPEKSQSELCDDELNQSDGFVQLHIDGENASVVNGSERTDDPVTVTPTKGRNMRRGSTVTQRRQRANQQRSMSLHAALSTPNTPRGEESSVQGSVATNMRSRRARSLRGKSVRKGEDTQPGSKLDVKRAKSLKGRIEADAGSKIEHDKKKIRRARSVEFENLKMKSSREDGEAPAFDWTAYNTKKDTAPAKEGAPGRKGKGGRRKSQQTASEKQMSGGLSKVIYAAKGQTVAS